MKSDEEAHSTVRPPATGDDQEKSRPDISGAILRAKNNASVTRSGPPSATAKINKFDLAQALAMTTADGEAVPPSTRPPREDDAPFVGGEVEIVGEEEVNSGVPGRDSLVPASRASRAPADVKISIKPPPAVVAPSPVVVEASATEPKKRSGSLVRAIIAALIGALLGLIVMSYVYLRTR